MALTLTTQAFADSLYRYLTNSGTIQVHLFTNNHTPTNTDTTSTYTSPVFTGYSPQTTTPPGSITPADPAVATMSSVTFTCTADGSINNCYGVYLEDGTGHLIGAQLFAAPIPVTYNGDSITVATEIDMAQC